MKVNYSIIILLLILLTSCNQAKLISKSTENRENINPTELVSNIKTIIDSINKDSASLELPSRWNLTYFWNIYLYKKHNTLRLNISHDFSPPVAPPGDTLTVFGFFKYKEDYIILFKDEKLDIKSEEFSKSIKLNTNTNDMYNILSDTLILPIYEGLQFYYKIDIKNRIIRLKNKL